MHRESDRATITIIVCWLIELEGTRHEEGPFQLLKNYMYTLDLFELFWNAHSLLIAWNVFFSIFRIDFSF